MSSIIPEKGRIRLNNFSWETIFVLFGGELRVKKRLASFVKRIYLLFRVAESPPLGCNWAEAEN